MGRHSLVCPEKGSLTNQGIVHQSQPLLLSMLMTILKMLAV